MTPLRWLSVMGIAVVVATMLALTVPFEARGTGGGRLRCDGAVWEVWSTRTKAMSPASEALFDKYDVPRHREPTPCARATQRRLQTTTTVSVIVGSGLGAARLVLRRPSPERASGGD